MSSLRPTLSASVAPPASVRASSPIRCLSAELLQAPAIVVLALLTPAPPFPEDPESASASDFFAAFGDDDVLDGRDVEASAPVRLGVLLKP